MSNHPHRNRGGAQRLAKLLKLLRIGSSSIEVPRSLTRTECDDLYMAGLIERTGEDHISPDRRYQATDYARDLLNSSNPIPPGRDTEPAGSWRPRLGVQGQGAKKMKYTILGGARYGGRCVVCDKSARDFEAVLLRGPMGKFAVAHTSCAGVRMKGKVGGGRVQVGGPDHITVPD